MSATIRKETLLSVEVGDFAPPHSLMKDGKPSEDGRHELRPGYSGIEEHSTPFHSFLEHGMSWLFPVVLSLNLYYGLARLHALDSLWLLLLAIPVAIVAGDFLSGLVHWFADTYFSEDTPIIGPSLVKPFRLHHIYPRDICTHDLVTVVGNVCILAVPVLAICLGLLWLAPDSGWVAFKVICVALMATITVATNQFHKWAHQEEPSTLARWLQRSRLVLEPSHHQVHHTAPFNMHYCITNGWLNPLLNKIKFFRRLETGLSWFGIRPSRSRDHY